MTTVDWLMPWLANWKWDWEWFRLFVAFALGGVMGFGAGFLLGIGINGAARVKL